jgi:hypothetical protein
VLSSNSDIYNSESPKYRDPSSCSRFHSRSRQELEVPHATPPKSCSSSQTRSIRLSVTQASMKTITSAALPLLLQIAAAEGIATKFTLTPGHTFNPMQSCGVNLMASYSAGWKIRHGECRCQHLQATDSRSLDMSINHFASSNGKFEGAGPCPSAAKEQQKQSSAHNVASQRKILEMHDQ